MLSRLIKNYELKIALRYLISKQKESFISLISLFSLVGIALGVATLIIVMSVMNGYEKELINHVLGLNGHLAVRHSHAENIVDPTRIINELPETEYVIPMLAAQSMIMSEYGSTGAMVNGLSAEDMDKLSLSESLIAGNIEDFIGEHGIIIGDVMSNTLGVTIGDEVKLIAQPEPHMKKTVLGIMPRMKTYKIIGIFDIGMREYNGGVVFMPITIAEKFFQKGVNEIRIRANAVEDVPAIKASLKEKLGHEFIIIDWMESNATLMSALQIERNVMFLILTLIILVAVFNIISSLTMLVKDKKRDIAILRTIGITEGSVLKIFIISGLIIGLIGTIVGVVLGVLFSLNIQRIKAVLEKVTGMKFFDPVVYFLNQLPSELDPYNVLYIATMSISLSFLATIIPARRAAKLRPAEALRYE
jgi:lipoprotein-releasing system permease protein